jgi:hypothetical protein
MLYALPLSMKTAPSASAPHPLTIGLRAARANLLPGLVVQGAVAAVLLAYFFYPPAREWLESLAGLKERWGYGFAGVSGAVAGAILPEILVVLLFQRGRVCRSNWGNLVFGIPYWGSQSMVVDAFYRLQAVFFGTQADTLTVIKKMMLDQFAFTPFYSVPFAMACFTWKNNGYRLEGMRRVFTVGFYKEVTLPAVVAAWGVWIPVVCMVYALPSLLQIPLYSLALTFWAMILVWISRQKK